MKCNSHRKSTKRLNEKASSPALIASRNFAQTLAKDCTFMKCKFNKCHAPDERYSSRIMGWVWSHCAIEQWELAAVAQRRRRRAERHLECKGVNWKIYPAVRFSVGRFVLCWVLWKSGVGCGCLSVGGARMGRQAGVFSLAVFGCDELGVLVFVKKWFCLELNFIFKRIYFVCWFILLWKFVY